MFIELKYWLSNFLPYSIESWAGLLGHYNQIWWPFSLIVLPLTLTVLWLSHQPTLLQRRFGLWLLSICWLWSGLVFLRIHFATLNWSASYASWLFVMQALLLVIYTGTPKFRATVADQKLTGSRYAIALTAFGTLPLIQLFSGYQLDQLAWFALTPDPTALVTLTLLASIRYLPKGLLLIPLIWGAIVFAHSWPLNDVAGMALLPLSVFLLLTGKRL